MNDFALQKQAQSLVAVDPAAVAAAESAKARIQAAYIMALQKPRNEDQARARILAACRRPEFADRVEFSKPVAGRKIKGPSIRFAELALREWGNILSDISVIYEDDHTKRIRIGELDLETNANFTKEITIKKTVERKNNQGRQVLGNRLNTNGETVYIVAATEDELNNKENALISKTIRNEGLRLIPSDIIDEAIATAKQTMHSRDSQDPQGEKKKVLDAFMIIGIQPKDVESYLGHPLDTISPAELQDLRGVYRAIRDGEQSWSDYVKPEKAVDETAEKLNGLTKKTELEHTEPDPDFDWYHPDHWLMLRSGYPTFIEENAGRLAEIPDDATCTYNRKPMSIIDAMRKKWYGKTKEPFPGDEPERDPEPELSETTVVDNGDPIEKLRADVRALKKVDPDAYHEALEQSGFADTIATLAQGALEIILSIGNGIVDRGNA